MRLPFPRRAESLSESIIAITVSVLATTAALSLIRTSISGNRVISEKVIAVNLALEAIEAVKNIRDTNYLNFSSKPEDCWDAIDASNIQECDLDYGTPTATLMRDLGGQTFYLQRNWLTEDHRLQWTLTTNSIFEDLTHYQVLDSSSAELTEIYAQTGINHVSADFVVIEEDLFTRKVEFSTYTADADNAVNVTVTVGWDHQGQEYSVSLTRTIANVF